MSRLLKGVLLGSIGIALLYLLLHAREPLRLNLGDPSSDANVLRFLGTSQIGTLRLVALMFSTLAMWLLFSYVRRLHSDRIALIATALFSTSLLWMMYADSIHQAPVMQCTGFLALWGLVRAIETGQRRHHAALLVGAFGCCFSSSDYYVFLPAAMLATVNLKAGHPFSRGNRHLVVLGALGCMLGILAKCVAMIGSVGWNGFVADLQLPLVERVTAAVPTIIRRSTLVFTPVVWVTAAYHVVKAVRAPNPAAAVKDTAVWMLLAALASLCLFAPGSASQMRASQALLPFYAVGSALVLDRLLGGSEPQRRVAFVWIAAAPLWSFYFMFAQPRSVLDRDDVATTTAYLAANDDNDFVLSNLMSDGPIHASFRRHGWPVLAGADARDAPREMMRVFELTGADHVHEIIFTGPESRFIDKSLWPLAMPRKQWAITGWPHMFRNKTNAMITEYDARAFQNLEAVKAKKVLQLTNYAVDRVDRATVMAILEDEVPTVSHIDFGSVDARRHQLLGWKGPILVEGVTAASSIQGLRRCPLARCRTVAAEDGLETPEAAWRQVGQVMIRVDPGYDLRLTFTFASPSYVRFSINGFSTEPMNGMTATFTVPAKHVTAGVNVVEIENMWPPAVGSRLYVCSLDLASARGAP